MMFGLQIEKVLVLDGVDASCKQILQSHGMTVDERAKLSRDELQASLPFYDAVVVRSATKVRREVLSPGTTGRLKLISRAGTGVDNIDVDAATTSGILVMNAPGGNTFSAAEHACGLMMAVARNIAAADSSMKAGQWDRKTYTGCELDGKTLGVLGVGRIGRAVAVRMQAFGMKTVGYDPLVPPSTMRENGVEPVELEELWEMSDFITVHTPLLPSTKGMLGKEAIAKCKKGVRIINAARGGIVDETALLTALNSGQCGGAGLDVYEEEPPTNRKLIEHPHVTACPHLGASTPEAQQRCGQEIGEQIVGLAEGTSAAGIINCPAISSSIVPAVGPYLTLSTALGKLSAWVTGKSQEYILSVGDVHMKQHMSCLGIGMTVGVLKQLGSGSTITMVNAKDLSQGRGLTVGVEFSNQQSGNSLIVRVGKQSVVSGLVNGDRAFITGMNGFSFELSVQGHVLLVRGRKPCISPKELLQNFPVGENATVLLSSKEDAWICILQTAHKLPNDSVTALSKLNGVEGTCQVDYSA